jgi:putative transposase
MAHNPHRKLVKHYDEPGHSHELTFSCYGRRPLLANNDWRMLLSEGIERAISRHQYRLVAFVYMPEHVHLLVLQDVESSGVDALLRAIKRPVSYRIKQRLIESASPLLGQLTVHQRPGVSTFRFWQEGPAYDRNLVEATTIESAIGYIHENPVRRGLCRRAIDWRWSSARHYIEPSGAPDPGLPRIHGLPAGYLDALEWK